jgi:hypothetical protein
MRPGLGGCEEIFTKIGVKESNLHISISLRTRKGFPIGIMAWHRGGQNVENE